MMQTTFHVNDGYKSLARSSKAPTPPEKPTNKPVYFGDGTDEEIVRNTKYQFTEKVENLLANPKNARRRKPGPPRPQNGFILYRRDKAKKHKPEHAKKKLKSCEISAIIGRMWEEEDPKNKELFMALARLSEKIHSQQHGGYKYQPSKPRAKKKKVRTTSKKARTILENGESPDSPASHSTSSPSDTSSLDSSLECNSPNTDFSIDSFDSSDESYNLGSNFCALNNINLNPLVDLDNTGSNPPTESTVNFGILDNTGLTTPAEYNNMNNMAFDFSNFITPAPVPPVQPNFLNPTPPNDDSDFNQFFTFAVNLYNFLLTNPTPFMQPTLNNDNAFKLYDFWRTNHTRLMQSMQPNDDNLSPTLVQPNPLANTVFLGRPLEESDFNEIFNF